MKSSLLFIFLFITIIFLIKYNQCEEETFTCFGILGNETTVCSGNGDCIAEDKCKCKDNYFGEKCENQKYECFGILGNETTVCSGNGDCIAKDKCKCKDNYFGEKCEVTQCNKVLSNDTNTCSGHGACKSLDFCECSENYFGNNCEVSICFNILSNNTNVCSGNGECISPNECECDPNRFIGEKCEVPLCYGISATEKNVCSGNGVCSDFNRCVCYLSFYGNDCSTWSFFDGLSYLIIFGCLIGSLFVIFIFFFIILWIRRSKKTNYKKRVGNVGLLDTPHFTLSGVDDEEGGELFLEDIDEFPPQAEILNEKDGAENGHWVDFNLENDEEVEVDL